MTIRARVLTIIGVVALGTVSFGFTVELLRSNFVSNSPVATNYLTLATAGWLAALVTGTCVVMRRARGASGWLLVVGAILAGYGYWRFSTHPWAAALGLVAFYATGIVPFHAAVVHGGGVSRVSRRVLVATDLVLAVLGVTIVATAETGVLDRWFVAAAPGRSVENKLLLTDAPDVARAAQTAWWAIVVTVASLVLLDRLRRWHQSPRRARRQEFPVVAAAAAWVAVTAGAAACMLLDRVPGARSALVDFGAVALPSIALVVIAMGIGWVELVEPRLSRSTGGAIELRSSADRSGVRALLAEVLASPKVDVAYARDGEWLDASGREIDFTAGKRRATYLHSNGEVVAAVLHDPDVPADAVQLAARLVGAQVDAERATALARARAVEVRDAVGELVRAGDRAAIAVTTDLLDGPLPELHRLAARLRTDPDAIGDAPDALREVTARVRELSHGLLPRDLETDGLASILGARARVDRRLPHAVEVTVYLLMVDDTAATAEDTGDHVVVRRSVVPTPEAASRTTALGGTLDGTVAIVPAE